MADWHHSLISWPGGGGQPDAQSKRLTETRSGKQIRNCYILPQFTHIFATPGCLFGDFSKRGPKFCGKCTTCFVIDFFVLSQAEKQEETVNKYKGWCKRSVSNCIILICNWFLGLKCRKTKKQMEKLMRQKCLQMHHLIFFLVQKILNTCPKTKVGARKVSSTASSIWKERRVFGANCSLSPRNCTCKQKFTFNIKVEHALRGKIRHWSLIFNISFLLCFLDLWQMF